MGAFARLLISLGLLCLAWQARAEIRLIDARGAVYQAARPPQRIVTLLPSLTESVCALGGCDRLVGTDRFSNWPASVAALPKLGGLDDPQVERVVALRPDVVIVEPSTRIIDRLESLGVRVFVVDVRAHADVRRSLTTLATLLGAPERAQAAWRQIEAELDEAARDVPAALRGRRAYVEVDATPYAAGAASFIGETLARLGVGNVVPVALGAFPRLNPEYVVKSQPDLIVAASANLADMPRRPGWGHLSALRERRTCAFGPADYELVVRPGPRMGQAARLLARCLAGLAEPR